MVFRDYAKRPQFGGVLKLVAPSEPIVAMAVFDPGDVTDQDILVELRLENLNVSN